MNPYIFGGQVPLYQVTSALCKAVRFGGLTAAEGECIVRHAVSLGIQLVATDEEQVRAAHAWTVRLNGGAAHGSFYLALAGPLDCELWTADRRLHNAVSLPWVQLA
jgi:predicted nucleic acid-binding protein